MKPIQLYRKKVLFTFFISLLILMLFAISWLGQHSARIRYFLLILICAGGIIWLIVQGREGTPLYTPKFILPLILFNGYEMLSIVFSPMHQSAHESSLMAVLFLITFIFFLDSLQGAWMVETWEKALVASAILYVLPEFLSLLTWLQKWWALTGSKWTWPPLGFRINGFFLPSANVMAGYINLALPFVVIRLLRERRPSRKVLWSLCMLFFFIIQYFTSSRGGWISAIVGIGGTLYVLRFKELRTYLSSGVLRRSVRSRVFILGLLIFLVVGGVINPIFIRQIQQTPGHTPGDSGRIEIWTNSLNVFPASPVFGNGLSSMGVLYAIESKAPPGFVPDHAHNLLLQVAGEFGLVGLFLMLCTSGWVAWTLFQTWKKTKGVERASTTAIAGAFISLSIHHLVDYQFGFYQFTIAVLLLLAMLAHLSPEEQKFSVNRKILLPILGIALLGYLIGFLFILEGITPFQRGVSAAIAGDWVSARDGICAAHDENPENSYFAFQCSLANAQVAFLFDDQTALEESISAQYAGLEIDPYWPPHWANLATLEWEKGERQQALNHMKQASVSAPRNWIFLLNLGWMEEQLGLEKDALKHYKSSLTLNPWIATSAFFNRSNLRQQATYEFEPFQNPHSSDHYALEGVRLLNVGESGQAEEMFNQALFIDSHNSDAYAWFAQLLFQQGQIDKAWDMITLGIFVNRDSPVVYLVANNLAEAIGNDKLAMDYLLKAYQLFQNDNLSQRYYAGLYKRGLLPSDLVPQMVLPEVSNAFIEKFTELSNQSEFFHSPYRNVGFSKWLQDEQEQ